MHPGGTGQDSRWERSQGLQLELGLEGLGVRRTIDRILSPTFSSRASHGWRPVRYLGVRLGFKAQGAHFNSAVYSPEVVRGEETVAQLACALL